VPPNSCHKYPCSTASRYAVADQVRTGDCLELQQVRGARIVPTGDQPVDHAALR